jgi:hypothetical protein
MKKNFTDYCREMAKMQLPWKEDMEVKASDIGDYIMDDINYNGTLTESEELALEYLCEWRADASAYWKFERDVLSGPYTDPFDDPEDYMVLMVTQGVISLINQCPSVIEYGCEDVTLTRKLIDTIRKELDEVEQVKW